MLISMAVYDTKENKRTELTRKTLESLGNTVNFARHHLIVVDNGSCQSTLDLYKRYHDNLPFSVIYMNENVGTAVAINEAWKMRAKGEHCVKMDNDVVIHEPDWADMIEQVFTKDPDIAICALKRKDLMEWPMSYPPWQSKIRALPHSPGERWLVVEEVEHCMGTVQAYSSLALDKIGYLYQFQDKGNLYGFDDSLAAFRVKALGLKSVFLPHINIDHLETGVKDYIAWKRAKAGEYMDLFHQYRAEYLSGSRDVYYPGP
jgi:glycosyltransferase involved in cell wall biosynthesis